MLTFARSHGSRLVVLVVALALVSTLLGACAGGGSTAPTSTRAEPTLHPEAQALLGHYLCSDMENGMLVGVGSFEIKADGTIVDNKTSQVGSWTYDPAADRFTIEGLEVTQAEVEGESLRFSPLRGHAGGEAGPCGRGK